MKGVGLRERRGKEAYRFAFGRSKSILVRVRAVWGERDEGLMEMERIDLQLGSRGERARIEWSGIEIAEKDEVEVGHARL